MTPSGSDAKGINEFSVCCNNRLCSGNLSSPGWPGRRPGPPKTWPIWLFFGGAGTLAGPRVLNPMVIRTLVDLDRLSRPSSDFELNPAKRLPKGESQLGETASTQEGIQLVPRRRGRDFDPNHAAPKASDATPLPEDLGNHRFPGFHERAAPRLVASGLPADSGDDPIDAQVSSGLDPESSKSLQPGRRHLGVAEVRIEQICRRRSRRGHGHRVRSVPSFSKDRPTTAPTSTIRPGTAGHHPARHPCPSVTFLP